MEDSIKKNPLSLLQIESHDEMTADACIRDAIHFTST